MIIIAENKKHHYIVKNFLTAIAKVKLNESYQEDDRHHVGFYPIVKKDEDIDVTDTEVITQYKPVTIKQLQKASKIKPKMINLAKLVKSGIFVSILAASSYFYSDLNNSKVTQDIAKDNNISVEEVTKVSPQINNNENEIQFNNRIENDLNTTTNNNDSIDTEEKTIQSSSPKQTA